MTELHQPRGVRPAAPRHVRRWRCFTLVAASLLAIGLLVALLAKGPGRSTGNHIVTLGRTGSKESAAVGASAPAFSAIAIDGQRVIFPTVHPTAVFFMSGLCPTCIAEARTAAQVQTAFAGQVSVLAIDADPTDSAGVIRQFEEAVGVPIHYPFVSDSSGRLVEAFGATSTDEWAIVTDAAGHVVYRGQLSYQALRAALIRAGALA